MKHSNPIENTDFAVAVIVSLLSAWLPVRRASRLPIKDVVLGTVEERHIPRPLIVGMGIVLFAVSALLPHFASGNMLYLAGGFSLLGLIAATILVIPIFTNIMGAGLERFYGVIAGNEGRIAARNMKDNKNITQNITLLFISISTIIVISVVGSFVTTYISDVFHGAELQGFADGRMETEFVEQVEEMEGTDNLEWYSSMLALNYTNNSFLEQAAVSFQRKERSVILSERCLEHTGFSIGDEMILSNFSLYSRRSRCDHGTDKGFVWGNIKLEPHRRGI